jgi:predicted nucleic acid-binding protein
LIVIDSSAIIEWLLQTTAGRRIQLRVGLGSNRLYAPHVLDLEVAHVLRRLVRERTIPARHADEAIAVLRDFPITRHPHTTYLPRIWEHRHTLSAYDAAYVVLAEALGATLITRDARLAAAPGHTAKIELF